MDRVRAVLLLIPWALLWACTSPPTSAPGAAGRPIAANSSPTTGAAATTSATTAVASPQPEVSCQFVAGFAAMRDLLGPDVVGPCVEDERFVAGNGNAEQRTTNGLLVLSGLDGVMRFVTDTRTWINTPSGVVERPTPSRLEWEGDRQLIENLRRGGFIIYFRHGATDSSQQDSDPRNLSNCATQRNLTDAGRQQAAMIGEQFRALQIPVGRVISSEYCRAREHAQLAFGEPEFEPSIVLPDPLPPEEQQANTAAFQRLLSTLVPPPGSNVVIVAHSPNIRNAAGVDLPVEGGAAIFSPTPDAMPALLGRVIPSEWVPLAAALARR